jgi:hypothetical protein
MGIEIESKIKSKSKSKSKIRGRDDSMLLCVSGMRFMRAKNIRQCRSWHCLRA